MTKLEFCYEDCEHLNLTEDQQNARKDGKRIPHICKLYNKRVLHNGHPAYLTRLEECEFTK